MAQKDALILLLVSYGFIDIKINPYRGVGNVQGYRIEAYNKERDVWYVEENCEGILFNITHIIKEMAEYKIEPTYSPFNGQEYSIKEILKMFNNKLLDEK